MTNITFEHPWFLLALPIAALAGGALLWWSAKERRKAIEKLTGKRKLPLQRILGESLCLLALLMVLLAIAGPQWPGLTRSNTASRDIVFLVDSSRSMFVRDIHPNRNEAVKRIIQASAEKFSGHQLGLAVFGEDVTVLCAPSKDRNFFRKGIEQQGWLQVTGGSNISGAIIELCDALYSGKQFRGRDIILFTDGGFDFDEQASIEKVAATLKKAGCDLLIFGVGNPAKESFVPGKPDAETGDIVRGDDGKRVLSRLNSKKLQKMANASERIYYIPVATKTFDLAQIYSQYRHTAAQRASHEEQEMTPHFREFIWVAGSLLLAGLFSLQMTRGNRKNRRTQK